MRKIAVIFLCLVCGWFFGAASEASCTPRVVTQVFESPVADQLQCEREYNSDLGLPQQIAAESIRTLSVRTTPCPERLGVRCGVACGHDGRKVVALPEFTIHLFYAGADAVGYHVYRLRRLRI